MAEDIEIIRNPDSNLERDELDLIDGYERSMLDRDLLEASRYFSDTRGPLMRVLTDIFSRQGQIALLDAGCGTGHTLWEFKEHLLRIANKKDYPELVKAVGVNEKDYSDQSMFARVSRDVRDGYLDYIIGDLETVHLPKDIFDVGYMYEVLFHNTTDKAVRIIRNILPSIKPLGLLWFNLPPMQFDQPEFTKLMDNLKNEGVKVFTETYSSRWGPHQQRTSVQLTLPNG